MDPDPTAVRKWPAVHVLAGSVGALMIRIGIVFFFFWGGGGGILHDSYNNNQGTHKIVLVMI